MASARRQMPRARRRGVVAGARCDVAARTNAWPTWRERASEPRCAHLCHSSTAFRERMTPRSRCLARAEGPLVRFRAAMRSARAAPAGGARRGRGPRRGSPAPRLASLAQAARPAALQHGCARLRRIASVVWGARGATAAAPSPRLFRRARVVAEAAPPAGLWWVLLRRLRRLRPRGGPRWRAHAPARLD